MKYKTNVGILEEEYDVDAENPRTFSDHYTHFYTFLRSCNSPDETKHESVKTLLKELLSPRQFKEVDLLYKQHDWVNGNRLLVDYALKRGYVLRPVWKYEHGNVKYFVTMHCPNDFDTCLAGYIFCSKKEIYENFQKRCTKGIIAIVEETFDAEVKEYTDWANGDVYCYRLDDGDWIGGFYGDLEENGALDEFNIEGDVVPID